MKMSKMFLSIILSAARLTPAHGSNQQALQRTFQLQKTPELLNVAASWATTSAASCANNCLSLYPDDCQAFIFKPSTGLCMLVTSSHDTSSTVDVVEGDLYYTACDVSKGFQYVVNGTTKACLGIFRIGNYSVAAASCISKGAVLMSVRTVERLTVLLQASGSKSVWVGCDDLAQRFTYRWKDDGSVLTNETISQVFIPGDPNYGAGEDCVCLSGDRGKLADYTCSYQAYYACEFAM